MKKKLLQLLAGMLLLIMPNVNFGQAPNLGTTSSFALFTAVGAFNNLGASVVTGDIGTNVGAFSGFPPGIVFGQIHVTDPVSVQAATDVDVAYSYLFGLTCGMVISTTMGNGQSLTPNIYCLGAASTINGDLILDGLGNPNSLFIFKIDGALSTTVMSRVILTNSASICNVYWQVNGAVALGDGSVFRGTIVANGAISLLEAATLYGRGLSRAGAISTHNNVVNLALAPTASIISANGSTTLCAGDSVTLTGNIGGTWNTGATSVSIIVKTVGDYFVTNTTSCGTAISNHIKVNVNPLPSCTISGNGSICTGQSTQLCAPSGTGYTYNWSNLGTARCIMPSSAGIFKVTVSQSGCKSVCSKAITINPVPNCNIAGANSICLGSISSLCAPAGYSNYLWNTGAKTNCITISAGGKYSVTVTNSNGCTSNCSKTIIAYPNPACNITGNLNPPVGQSNSLCASSGMATYKWSTGANTRCIIVKTSGTYSVTITNYSGCTSSCSVIVNFMSCLVKASYDSIKSSQNRNGFSIEPINNYILQHAFGNIEVSAYPNPFNSKAILEFRNTESDSHVVIELYNLSGSKIAKLFDNNIVQGLMYNAEVNAEKLIEGIYIYRIINGNQLINGKLILVR